MIIITLKKTRDNDFINRLHHDAWIDYKKGTKPIFTALLGDHDQDKSSFTSPTIHKERERPTDLLLLVHLT